MHVEFTARAEHSGWGGWALGDLAVAVCRAVEVVGPSANVVTVVPTGADDPDGYQDGPPVVTLVVGDRAEADRLRYETEHGEYVATFAPEVGIFAWVAAVNGIRLEVTLRELEDSIVIYPSGA